MSRIRELFSDSLIYGLSSVVARFINYLLVPFYTLYFDPAEYGVIGLIYAAIVFLNVIYTFGMESSYIRYAANEKDKSAVFVTLQVALLVVATALSGMIWASGDFIMPLMSLDMEGGLFLFGMMLTILWLDGLSIVPYAHLRLIRRSLAYAVIKLTNVIINVALNLYLVIVAGWGLEAILISNVIASAVSLLMLFVVTLPLYRSKPNLSILKTALLFGLPYVPNGIGFAINEVLDRFFLNAMDPDAILNIYGTAWSPEEITGIYNACYKLAVFMLLVVQMFRLAWQPFFMRHADSESAPELFSRVFLLFNVAAAGVFIFVGVFVHEIVAVNIPVLNGTIIDSRYWDGLHIVPFLLMAYWFQGMFVNFSAGIFIKEKTGLFPRITFIGAGFTLALNFILVPFLGMLGSALATLTCYGVMSLLTLYHSQKVFPVPYHFKHVILIVVAASVTVFIGSDLDIDSYNTLLLKALICIPGIIVILATGYHALPSIKNGIRRT